MGPQATGWAAQMNRIMTATLIGFTGTAALAETPEPPVLLPQWEPVFSVRSGGGYKDNVFLSHANPQGSAFLSAGADLLALRVAPEGPQFSLFAGADTTHFLQPSHHEATAFALAKVEQDFHRIWQGSFAVEYLYQDQFADVAFLDPGTNVAVRAAAIRSHMITARPAVELALPRELRLALELPVTRAYYNDLLDDDWRGGLKLALARDYGSKSELSTSYGPTWRWYDEDPALTSSGASIPGTQRERIQHEAQLTWRHHWDKPMHWRTTAKCGSRMVEENGGGYADHTQLFASVQVRYRCSGWEIAAAGGLRYYDYRRQTLSAMDARTRARTEWSAGINFERRLTKHLGLAVSLDHERTLSNDELESYSVNAVSGTLQWEF